METYSISNHTLAFSDDYTALLVKQNDQTIATFYLTGEVPVSVYVADAMFHVGCNGGFLSETAHKYDVDGGQAELSFNGTRLGGIGIVDLRDCGKKGNFAVEYNLECCNLHIACVSGPKPVRIQAICYTHTPN